jgi:hypothetical protein
LLSSQMPQFNSLGKQDLLLEFASLKHASPDGVYATITPGDPSLWAGVLFIRTGPYAPAVLRFQISFPDTYPHSPPLLTFSNDIFHPLLTPLTTYTYTGAAENDTFSASDEERLPPGGFSLRHGFPQWFRRTKSTPRSSDGSASSGSQVGAASSTITVYEVLDYVRLAFTDENFLDSLPLDAAANPGAYRAWHTHREQSSADSPPGSRRSSAVQSPNSPRRSDELATTKVRRPGQWNWEGVWEERVKKGIQTSLSEPVLFGAVGAGDDIVCAISSENGLYMIGHSMIRDSRCCLLKCWVLVDYIRLNP